MCLKSEFWGRDVYFHIYHLPAASFVKDFFDPRDERLSFKDVPIIK